MTERVPSRVALEAAEADVRERGFELMGAVSEEHGFLPPTPPLLAFPESHAAWDEMVATLPTMWRDVSVRRLVERMPTLPAGPDALPDRYLRRAAVVLSFLAHSCWISDTEPATSVPSSVMVPWQQVAQRMGRFTEFMHYDDIITNNWRLKDPAGPPVLDNLELLVPTVGTPAEAVFYLVQVEMMYRSAPLIGGVVRAQEAAVARDTDRLEHELAAMIEVVRFGRERTFLQIDPMESSRTYVDPVIWGSTVANFAISVNKDIPNPGGTAAQVFHLLDAFLGRRTYESVLGDETVRLRDIAPPLLREYLDAVEQVSVRELITASGSRSLRGMYDGLMDVYAGSDGLLQSHRIKAYGYLEIAFKAGREQTLSGFTGRMLKKVGDEPTTLEQAWRTVDRELDISRRERTDQELKDPQLVTLTGRRVTPEGSDAGVHHLVLDVSGRGVHYRPGDRVGILPQNPPELVTRTVAALGGDPDAEVELTVPWLARAEELGHHEQTMPLAQLLTHARLRPVPRDVGKALLTVTGSARLRAVLEARNEDQLELWDALEMVAADGYDTTRLLKARVWQDESLARIVPPDARRLYSVSSAPEHEGPADELHLTVESLSYITPGTVTGGEDRQRRGATSTWLNRDVPSTEPDTVRVKIVPAVRFWLPDDPAAPVAMFAGGTGVSPFRGFVEQRAREGATDTWLLLGTRSVDRFYHREELATHVEAGHLRVDVAFSREDAAASWRPGATSPTVTSGEARRIDGLMRDPDVAQRLWSLLRRAEDGGEEGYLYVCGQAAFALTVIDTLTAIAREQLEGSEQERDLQARTMIRRLVADRRLMLDVFTTFAPATAPGTMGDGLYDASELVLHNDDERGWWCVIDGMVYDLTEFQHQHPGGHHIVRESGGRDATDEFAAILHADDPEIVAMASMYKIGQVRRLDLGDVWGIAMLPTGIVHVSLHDLFRLWVNYLYFVVEVQNSVRMDFSAMDLVLSSEQDGPQDVTVQKLMLFGSTHQRFARQYVGAAIGEDMTNIWGTTVGLCDPSADAGWITGALAEVTDSDAGRAYDVLTERIGVLYRDHRDAGTTPSADVMTQITLVRELNLSFVTDLKTLLREGVMLFERHEAATAEQAGTALVELLRRVPEALQRYMERFVASVEL